MQIEDLKNYLIWLLTPQNAEEAAIWKYEGFADDYIEIKNNIDSMSREDLIKEINIQLAPYGKEIQL